MIDNIEIVIGMKRLLIIFLLVFSFPKSMFAQHTVIGKITDNQAAPLAFANIVVSSSSDSAIRKGTISDSLGNFRINNLLDGRYKLVVTLLNYLSYTAYVNINADTSINIELNGTQDNLNAVVVTARKPLFEKKADRFVFNVSNSPLAIGGSAWDVLQHAPLVMTNNNSLSIIGVGSSTVYINNRKSVLAGEDLARYLQSMPSDNIVKIEIITSPSARYEAGTAGGILNIILKKNPNEGLNGSLTLSSRQATYNKQNGSLQLNYHHNKYSQSLTVGTGFGKQLATYDNVITYIKPQQQERLNESYIANSKPITISTAIDYELSTKSAIGVMVDFQNAHNTPVDLAQNYVTRYLDNTPTIDSFFNKGNTSANGNYLSGNLYYKFSEEKRKRTLEVNVDYLYFKTKNSQEFLSYYIHDLKSIFNGYQSGVQQNINNCSAKIDYSQVVLKDVVLEIGGKHTYTETKNPYDFFNYANNSWVYNPGVSNYFIYKERIIAGYGSLEKKISSRLTAKAGIRVEQTHLDNIQITTSENYQQKYTRMLPTAYLSYTFNKNNSLSFSFRSDFIRPPYASLNPFTDYSSNKILIRGNPFLQPSRSTQYELSYVLKNNYIFMARYAHNSSLFGQVQTVVLPDTLSYSQANYGKSDIWTFTSVVNQTVIKKIWQINLTNSIEWKALDIVSDNIQAKGTYAIYNVTLNQTFPNLFKSGIDASLFGMYQSKYVDANIITKPLGRIDFGLSKGFIKSDIKLSLYINDIFKTAIEKNNTVSNAFFHSYLVGYHDNRFFRVSIIKKIGNKKLKKVQSRESGNSDEKARL